MDGSQHHDDALAELRKEAIDSIAAQPATPRSTPSQALVRFSITPSSIPRKTADPARVIDTLNQEFRARFDASSVAKYLPPELRGNLSPAQAFALTIDNDQFVEFVGGWLRLPDVEVVTPILRMRFGGQTVEATVAGTSDEALYLCKRLLILLWQAAGATRSWSDLEPEVESVSYQTTTVVDLGISMERLLSEPLRRFLADDVVGGQRHGARMGSFGSKVDRYQFQPTVLVSCRDIDLTVGLYDPVSGLQEDCTLRFIWHTLADINRSRVKLASELPTRMHNRMVVDLLGRLTA